MLWQMMEGMNSLGSLHKTRGLLLLRGQAQGSKALPGIQQCASAKGLTLWCLHGCRYWDEFHTCALTVLWKCQKEAAAVWEMLRRESRNPKFQGSLFDLCSPSMAQSFAWTRVPNISILSIPLIVTCLNL